MARDRAKAGGQVGTNGEFYEGGKFLPSTERPKGAPKRRKATGKVRIEPRVWAVPPEGMRSILGCWGDDWMWDYNGTPQRLLSAEAGEIRWDRGGDGRLIDGAKRRAKSADALARYLAGERFEPYPVRNA